jgi:hypothetical protein
VRHLFGTAAAVVLAAMMFFAGAWGYLRLLRLPAGSGPAAALPAGGGSLLGDTALLLALAAVVGTGVLAGLLVTVRRISPLAAGLPGVLLLGWTALYLVSVRQAVRLIPLRSDAFGAGWEALLFHGVLGAAGAALVIPLLIPSRWRATSAAGADAAARAADDLSAVWPDSGPRQQVVSQQERDDRPPAGRYRDDGPYAARRPQASEPAPGGRLMSGPDSGYYTRPVDTSRVTGASRALRATGSFRSATGAMPRSTGSFPGANDSSLLGRPYLRPEA